MLTKNKILKQQRILLEGQILQKEVEIDVEWVLLKKAEKEVEELKYHMEKITEEIRVEKEKTPLDLEKIEKLKKENEALGWTSQKDKEGNMRYKGQIGFAWNKVSLHQEQIKRLVRNREIFKSHLEAVNIIIKRK